MVYIDDNDSGENQISKKEDCDSFLNQKVRGAVLCR